MTIADLISQHPFQFWLFVIIIACSISDIGNRTKKEGSTNETK
jgi:hypothetical protein